MPCSCGEKDPLSDDTIVFAGRLREAKQNRKAEAQAEEIKAAKLQTDIRQRDPILDEDESDWLHMR